MKLLDLTTKDVDNISKIISEGSESHLDNVGLNGMMTEEEFMKAESILIDFEVTLRKLVEKQNLKETK